MVGGTILYALTSIFGYATWKVSILGLPPGPIMEFCLYLGSMGLAVPVAIRNTYRSYRDGTGKMRPFLEAVRPLISFLVALMLFMSWALASPNDILEKDPRMYFYVSGTVCANLSCRLIGRVYRVFVDDQRFWSISGHFRSPKLGPEISYHQKFCNFNF